MMQERGGKTDEWVSAPNARIAVIAEDPGFSTTIKDDRGDWRPRYVEKISGATLASGVSLPVKGNDNTSSPINSLSSSATSDVAVNSNWNTSNLALRVGADAASAACAGALVAPVITIIDKGIIENATGRRTLGASVAASLKTLLLRPHHFFLSKPFALIFTLYTGTYLTANTIDTVSSTIGNTSASTTTHGTAKFAATSAANLSLCLWKDTHFTRMFSTAAPRPIPMVTYGLFAARDCLTIFASFNLPPIIAPKLPMHLLPSFMQRVERQKVAQFITPAAVQIISTPMHLLGLDFYNRNGSTTVRQRWDMVRRAWAMSCLARICRIVPAFGVGGVVNTGVRKSLMHKLD